LIRQLIIFDVKNANKTLMQQTTIQQRRTNLLKSIQKFIAVRHKFMPGLNSYLASEPSILDTTSMSTPERVRLYFPSSFPSEQRSLICTGGIEDVEDRLRFAQASEALTKLRCQLMKRTYASRFKVRNISTQRHYTRFRTLQEQTENKIKILSLQYNIARDALLRLRGPGVWEKTLQKLGPEDVRGLSERALIEEEKEETRRTRTMAGIVEYQATEEGIIDNVPAGTFDPHLAVGEGHRTLSWIWYSTTGDELNNGVSTGTCKHLVPSKANAISLPETDLRVEWLKCRARAARWKEELYLIEEEMRRALEFCSWKVKWWEQQAHRRTTVPPHLQEGLVAYATENAAAECRRLMTWSNTWAAVRQRAAQVLENHLKDREDAAGLSMLNIEVEVDECDDDLATDWECDIE
jgi:hypothetical protein